MKLRYSTVLRSNVIVLEGKHDRELTAEHIFRVASMHRAIRRKGMREIAAISFDKWNDEKFLTQAELNSALGRLTSVS